MAHKQSFSSTPLIQIMAFIGLIVAGYFIFAFGRVALVGYQLRNTKATLQAEVSALEAKVAELESRKTFIQTDEYIEQAAREEYKMSRPGDQVIVPIFREEDDTGGAKEESAPEELSVPQPQEPWEAWRDLFFGQ